MILILFSILLINYILKLPFTPNILYCGIFAWNGKSVNSASIDKLKLLGIYNDSRGGQSLGMYYNKAVHKSINPYSKFKDYYENNIFDDALIDNVLIGHSRRASVGGVSLANAQPTVIELALADKKDDIQKLVLAHNGTISNYKKMGEDASINTKKLNTDSQVLAALLLVEGPKILEQYIGAASLIYCNKNETDVMYIFRGMSSMYKTSKYLVEERPLHYYQEHKNSIYFSSEEGALVAISKDKKLIKEVPGNILFKVKDGKMTQVQEINRDFVFQKEPATFSQGSVWPHENVTGYHNTNRNTLSSMERQKQIKRDDALKAEEDILESYKSIIDRKEILYYISGRHYIGEKLAAGKLFVDIYGFVYSASELKKVSHRLSMLTTMWFVDGMLMKNEKAYKDFILKDSADKFKKEGTTAYYREICEYTVFPVGPQDFRCEYLYWKHSPTNNGYWYGSYWSEPLKPIFSSLSYRFAAGDIQVVEDTEDPYYPKDFPAKMDLNGSTVGEAIDYYPEPLPKKLIEELLEIHGEEMLEDENDDTPSEEAQNSFDMAIAEDLEMDLIARVKEEIIDFINAKSSDLDMQTTSTYTEQFITTLQEASNTINEFNKLITVD